MLFRLPSLSIRVITRNRCRLFFFNLSFTNDETLFVIMSEIKISSTGWLAVFLRNGAIGVFDLNDIRSWQCLENKSIVDQSKDDNNENTNDFDRKIIKFSPNGKFLVVNGQDKQLNVYIESNFEETEIWWQLQRIINVRQHIFAVDLTNNFLLIADKTGDVYKIDLSLNDNDINFIVTTENRIMKNVSMSLDIAFIPINETKSFIVTANQDEKIHLSHYPNTSNKEEYCLGHTEFVSHIKLIDNNHILSASGDGTIRLWHFPDCIPLVLLHSKAFILSSKQIFYTQLYNTANFLSLEEYRIDAMPQESLLDSSLKINYSIWKMDVASYDSLNSDVYIAFSIYAYRSHSIYLTSLLNMKQLANEQRKLILDSSYGTIVDYCFPSKNILLDDRITDSQCHLYILFDSNILLKVDIISILLCDETELFLESDEKTQGINTILAGKEFHLMNYRSNNIISDEIIFKQCFKNSTNSNDSSHHKRKTDRIEQQQQQQQRKKQAPSPTEKNTSLMEFI